MRGTHPARGGFGGTLVRATVIGSIVVLVLASVVLMPASAAGPRLPGDAIAARLDAAYMRSIIEDITQIGSSPMGFRTAGTPEDLATATYIVDRMRQIGLEGAGIEEVPTDMWRFLGASLAVTAGGRTWTFDAASQGGVPPTPSGGLTGPIAYVGEGSAIEYDALEARGVSVEGKLALANWDSDDVWTNHIAMEAIARGALGTIITALPDVGDYYQAPGAIGSFDSVCDPVLCGSFITISREDARTILDLLDAGLPVVGTMRLDVEMALDVRGYNTIGYIRGSTHPDEYILFNGHHDAWFTSAIDCTSCVAGVLAIAKAVKESGYAPARTLVFMTTTGEEWGAEDTYYDWLAGSYWRIMETHPEWQGTAAAFINIEGSGFAGDPMEVNVNQELRPFVTRMLGRMKSLTPYGAVVFETYSWNELWTYNAAGVPGVTFSSASDTYGGSVYHTNLDTIDVIDFSYLRKTVEFVARFAVEVDRSFILPYDFTSRVKNLGDRLDYEAMASLLGTGDPTIGGVQRAFDRFGAAVSAYEAAKRDVPADRRDAFQGHAREAVRRSLTAFTGLNAWDSTIYPHEQLETDAIHLGMAVDDLLRGRVQGGLRHLEWWVAQTWYVPRMSYVPFTEEMDHHDPAKADGTVHLGGAKEMLWGGQGHLAPYWNLWVEYRSIREKAGRGDFDFSEEIESLLGTRAAAIGLYRDRLDGIAGALHGIAAELEAAVAALG